MADPVHIVLCEKHNPFPTDHGRATRLVTLARALRGLGFRVTILVGEGKSTTLNDGTRIQAVTPLAWPFRELHLLLELRKIHRESPVDFLQIQNDVFVVFAILAKMVRFRVTYDAQVVEAAFWSAQSGKSFRELASSKVMPLCERVLCRISDRVSALSSEDARRLETAHGLPPGKVVVVPFSLRLQSGPARGAGRPSGRPTVLFLGSYAHRPNADAIALIQQEIRPKVVRAIPDAVFQIIGKGLPVEALRANGLEAYSDVEEVAPFIDAATVCIAPIRVGSGVRVKLMEYLSRGKPVVAMRPAIEGLGVRPGIDLDVQDDVDAFAESIVALLEEPARRQRLAISGFERIRELTGEGAAASALRAFYPGKSPS